MRPAPGRLGALLALGLLLGGQALYADDVPPGRSVALSPPGADGLGGLGARVDRLAAQQQALAARTDDQARRLSDVADALGDQDARLKSQAAAAQGVEQRLTAAEGSLASVVVKLQALDEAQAKAAVSAAAQQTRLDGGLAEVDALKTALGAAQDQITGAAKDYAATRVEMGQRSEKLQGLVDLLDVLKKGLDSDDEELVEVKLALKRLEPKPAPDASLTNAAWWNGILTWKYLPALATGLGIVAVGTSLAHR